MAFVTGITTVNFLAANQAVVSSIVPVDITGFTFNLGAGRRLMWELWGIFSLGATGGFRFLAHSTTVPTTYNATFQVVDETTPTTFQDAQIAEAAFTNASAVASNYIVTASGLIVANAATVFSLQFAQNNSTANAMTMLAGARIRLTQI